MRIRNALTSNKVTCRYSCGRVQIEVKLTSHKLYTTRVTPVTSPTFPN